MCDTPEYRAWCHMKERCNNKTCKVYKHYGGRGITVCDRWSEFKNFYADMGACNSLSLDRIDNNGNYEPSNCRWADKTTQALNRSNNKNNTSGYRGVTWDKKKNKWYAAIGKNYKNIFLGYYSSPDKAYEKYLEARRSF